jgi:hypothetical protein
MNTKLKVVAGCATIAAAIVMSPKPNAPVDPSMITNPPLTCYSNESACDLINPTHGDIEYEPCVEEDQTTPCYWDASTRGNGKGQSFIVTVTGKVVYVK